MWAISTSEEGKVMFIHISVKLQFKSPAWFFSFYVSYQLPGEHNAMHVTHLIRWNPSLVHIKVIPSTFSYLHASNRYKKSLCQWLFIGVQVSTSKYKCTISLVTKPNMNPTSSPEELEEHITFFSDLSF